MHRIKKLHEAAAGDEVAIGQHEQRVDDTGEVHAGAERRPGHAVEAGDADAGDAADAQDESNRLKLWRPIHHGAQGPPGQKDEQFRRIGEPVIAVGELFELDARDVVDENGDQCIAAPEIDLVGRARSLDLRWHRRGRGDSSVGQFVHRRFVHAQSQDVANGVRPVDPQADKFTRGVFETPSWKAFINVNQSKCWGPKLRRGDSALQLTSHVIPCYPKSSLRCA